MQITRYIASSVYERKFFLPTRFAIFPISKLDNKEGRALFPRIEYSNEWQPVGRGDPLKDPTYSYQPPVLDRVRYWAEGTSHKNKNDILLLGVPSKKLSSVNQKADKFTYGPIKRTYYSPPFQSHFSSPLHHQQQQQYVRKTYICFSVSYSFEIFFIDNFFLSSLHPIYDSSLNV